MVTGDSFFGPELVHALRDANGIQNQQNQSRTRGSTSTTEFRITINHQQQQQHEAVTKLKGIPCIYFGYVGVRKNDDVQDFYYFIKLENNPKKDPFMLWLTGGPGCSVLTGLAFEIGPFSFKIEEYNGSMPNLVLMPQSWTKVSSIIFVDMLATIGFSYATTEYASQGSDWNQVHQIHQFLRKWLIVHPKFLSKEFYISGDSYNKVQYAWKINDKKLNVIVWL